MQKKKREKGEMITTPVGVASYPYLNSPNTKFNPLGNYSVDLILGGDEAQELVSKIDALKQAHLEVVKKENPAKARSIREAGDPYTYVVNDQGEETGEVKFKFKMKAKVENKKDGGFYEFRPALFDAKGKPLDKNVMVFGGSKVKVAGEARPFYSPALGVGVTLQLNAVQVIELVSSMGGGRNASAYGFGVEEGFESGVEESQEGEEEGESPTSEDYDF